ncbi:MAG: SDR family NAD(P)-dependent oxidoreductase [Pirellulales bacterium]
MSAASLAPAGAPRVALVTGGGSGIGQATCLSLAAAGYRVAILGRNQARLDETAQLIGEQAGAQAAALTCGADVTRAADVQSAVARVLDVWGRLDVLVTAAGILRAPGSPMRAVHQTEPSAWQQVIDINLLGTMLCAEAALPAMRAAGGGDIVTIASLAALRPLAYDAAYSASKLAVVEWTESLAAEVAAEFIRAQVVIAGPFRTDLAGQRWSGQASAAAAFPPPSRVADFIRYLVTRPRDVRLARPVIQPLAEWAAGVKSGVSAPPAPTATENQESRQPEASMGNAMGKLQGQVVLVTGAAGGIGRATCRAVAELGAAVVAADVDAVRLDDCLADIRQASTCDEAPLACGLDVRDEASVAALVAAIEERFGRLDALVHCAGVLRARGTPPKPVASTSLDEWNEVVDINLLGTFLLNRAVVPLLIKQRGGSIINVSSVSGLKGRAHDGAYCASKFGVIGLSQSLADEVRSYGIRVQALMPDAVDTPIWAQNHPLPPPGDALPPERVADLIAFMLTQPADTVLVGPVIAPLGARRRKLMGKSNSGGGARTEAE